MYLVKLGQEIVKSNQFYNTLYLILQCYFTKNYEMYFIHLLRSITNREDEFKVFMIHKDYAIKLYENSLIGVHHILQNRLYSLIGLIKTNYDRDRNVIQPYINLETSKESETINQYHTIKNSYVIRDLVKYEKINEIIKIMQQASDYDNRASVLYNKGIYMLFSLVTDKVS